MKQFLNFLNFVKFCTIIENNIEVLSFVLLIIYPWE
jgi:hypothetical protein